MAARVKRIDYAVQYTNQRIVQPYDCAVYCIGDEWDVAIDPINERLEDLIQLLCETPYPIYHAFYCSANQRIQNTDGISQNTQNRDASLRA